MTTAADMAVPAQVLFETLRAMQISSSALALYMIRFIVAMTILPVMGEQVINTLSRMGIAMMLAAFVSFGQPWDELSGLSGTQIAFIAVKEMMLGVALGFAMATVFWVIEFVGALIDTEAGYNSVQLQNPLGDSQATPVSDLLGRLAAAVFYAIGGALYFAQVMFDSFRVWPLADMAPSAHGAYSVFIERQVGDLFGNTIKLAAPVLIVLLLIDVGIGLLARSAEKLEPSSLAQPIKGFVAVLMLTMFVSVAFDQLRHHIVPRGVVQQLAPSAPAAPR
jgi:type III secretion protein T